MEKSENTFDKRCQTQKKLNCISQKNNRTRVAIDGKTCRVYYEKKQTVEHPVASCKILANSGYLGRRNRTLMILAVKWPKNN